MSSRLLFLGLALLFTQTGFIWAFDDEGPPISITSPDTGSTFSRAEIKNHSLIWYPKQKMLMACVTFTDAYLNNGQPQEDTHFFQLPGITLDETKGVFTATSAKGEIIPVARYKKTLFIKSIEILPNANVKIIYPSGIITVELLAISPNDPAMHPRPAPPSENSNPDGTHDVDLKKIFN